MFVMRFVLYCCYKPAARSWQGRHVSQCCPANYIALSTMLPFLQALSLWPRPAPGSLYALAARLQPEGLPLCCKAVHLDPWQESHRDLLGILAA